MNSARSSSFVVAALLLGAGVAGGLLAGALLASAPGAAGERVPVQVPGDTAGRTSQELAAATAELRAAAEALRAAAEQLRASPRVPATAAGTSPPAGDGTPDWRSLAASIDALASAVRRMEAGEAAAPLVAPGHVDRRAAVDALDLAGVRQTRDDELREATMAALRARHLFWTRQQVLDTYGRPDRVWLNDGSPTWHYQLELEDGGEEELYLRFHDGTVFEVDYAYTPARGR